MNKKGFTLVELLAVIVILAIILVIAVPNVLGIINKSRNDSFISTARMMVSAARLKSSTDIKYAPESPGVGKLIPMNVLDLENIQRDVDGGSYVVADSYVIVTNEAGVLNYYVTLIGSKRSITLQASPDFTIDATYAPVVDPYAVDAIPGVTVEPVT
ncbi:MAG: prepilin-type N-terminal cleavage/methylation domain-containing protein [Bacilli bacterium]|nr:prepilin-type N-terminal cleavage/methylation domain-containing protein [Bacilli bacterium]